MTGHLNTRSAPCWDAENDTEIERLFALARGEVSTPFDTLQDAIDRTRSILLASPDRSTKNQIYILWAAAKSARNRGTADVVQECFFDLAVEINLIDQGGRWTGIDVSESRRSFGAEDVRHVITWAIRNWNPFERGPLT